MAIAIQRSMTFAALLAPYRTQAVAVAVGAHPDTVRAWRRGDKVPDDPVRVKTFASFLHIDAGELLTILARDRERIAASRRTRNGSCAVA